MRPWAGLDRWKISSIPGFDPWTVQPVASRYTVHATQPTSVSILFPKVSALQAILNYTRLICPSIISCVTVIYILVVRNHYHRRKLTKVIARISVIRASLGGPLQFISGRNCVLRKERVRDRHDTACVSTAHITSVFIVLGLDRVKSRKLTMKRNFFAGLYICIRHKWLYLRIHFQ